MMGHPLFGRIAAGVTKLLFGVVCEIDTFGIASLALVNLDGTSLAWGRIAYAPKPGWTGIDLFHAFVNGFDYPVGLDTDVSRDNLTESFSSAAIGANIVVYVTVGAGIYGGTLVGERPVHRSYCRDHMRSRRHSGDFDSASICRFYDDCLEGLASSLSIQARCVPSLSNRPTHDIIAHYPAQFGQRALLSLRRIVLSGGVLATLCLLDLDHHKTEQIGSDYFDVVDHDHLIIGLSLGERAGLLGALAHS